MPTIGSVSKLVTPRHPIANRLNGSCKPHCNTVQFESVTSAFQAMPSADSAMEGMMSFRSNALIAVTALSVVGVGMSAPAQAHVGTGIAIGAGLLGLGVGAAIASDHQHHRYYDDGYYAPPPPPPAPVAFYAPPPPPPSYSYEYVQRCRVFERWNPNWGQYEQVRRCN